MPRSFFIALLLIGVVFISGCGAPASPTPEDTDTPATGEALPTNTETAVQFPTGTAVPPQTPEADLPSGTAPVLSDDLIRGCRSPRPETESAHAEHPQPVARPR